MFSVELFRFGIGGRTARVGEQQECWSVTLRASPTSTQKVMAGICCQTARTRQPRSGTSASSSATRNSSGCLTLSCLTLDGEVQGLCITQTQGFCSPLLLSRGHTFEAVAAFREFSPKAMLSGSGRPVQASSSAFEIILVLSDS